MNQPTMLGYHFSLYYFFYYYLFNTMNYSLHIVSIRHISLTDSRKFITRTKKKKLVNIKQTYNILSAFALPYKSFLMFFFSLSLLSLSCEVSIFVFLWPEKAVAGGHIFTYQCIITQDQHNIQKGKTSMTSTASYLSLKMVWAIIITLKLHTHDFHWELLVFLLFLIILIAQIKSIFFFHMIVHCISVELVILHVYHFFKCQN